MTSSSAVEVFQGLEEGPDITKKIAALVWDATQYRFIYKKLKQSTSTETVATYTFFSRAVVFPRADYGVNSFFPLPAAVLKPLECVNKSIAHCITGGYRTAALAALEKEAAILPAPLRLESALLHRLASYLSIPPSHGIVPLLHDAILRVPKNPCRASALHYVERLPAVRWPPNVPPRGARVRERKPRPPMDVTTDPRAGHAGSGARGKRGGAVDELYTQSLPPPQGGRQVTSTALSVTSHASASQTSPDLSLGMEHILPVYAVLWATPLPVSTVIPSKDQAISVLEQYLEDPDYMGGTWFTDGSLLAGRAGGAAVLFTGGVVVERLLLPLGDGQIESWSSLTRRLGFVLSCQHPLVRVNFGRSFTTNSFELLWRVILRSASLTSAHIETAGNEFADDAAKAATLLAPPPSIPVSLTTCKRQINTMILTRWEFLWSVATPGRGLREIDDSPPSLIMRSPYDSLAARASISILAQLRTDFSSLNVHRFRCRLTTSPACDACGAARETPAHFLLHCPAWDHLRNPLQRASYAARILGAVDVRTLLNHPKLLRPVITFITQTRRFC
ncbi:hypothetical protein DFH07DRAFT_968681 [Mycena maculata]|uniref:Reverse transcriptase zinc-binding domain-containing protein n=1 Tax=Mycena maculata TaxID=230809 RepID=A0AAD7HZK5_9AGAR|nr:hypothetical protein DFH07DRAFT_968681 [Mycena maculata]